MKNKTVSRERTKKLALSALFTALVAVGAFIQIPIATVPFTMQFLFTNLAGILLGWKYGTISLSLYLLIGLSGIPIFTKGGGIGYVLQPTFGYLIGFWAGAVVAGLICSKGRYSYPRMIIAGFVNLVIVYSLGMLYFDLIMKFYFNTPKSGTWIITNFCLMFLPMDSLWCIVSAIIAKRLLPVIYRNDQKQMLRISTVNYLKDKVINGKSITRREARLLKMVSLDKLSNAADDIRNKFCSNKFDLCSIVNAKNGGCSENCKFCAQSSCYGNKEKGSLIAMQKYSQAYDTALKNGVNAFSAVTSGKKLSSGEVDKMAEIYAKHSGGKIRLCASHGLLDKEELKKLKYSGVDSIHNNLETSEKYFPKICTTHTYEDKIKTIKEAQEVGLNVCSGCLIGLGESMNDRIEIALKLRELNVKSVPINILHPIEGTPMYDAKPLKYEEIIRTFAIFRFILPDVFIRVAAGRKELDDNGRKLFKSGANATISGDYLTTCGVQINKDLKMLKELGFEIQ